MNINDDHLKTLVAKAIIDSINPETREELIANAVKSLLTEKDSTYGTATKLQAAFSHAVQGVAREVAAEVIATPEVRAKVLELVTAGVTRAFQDDVREETVGKIADAVRKAMTGERY